jgi:Protein of unknown function (DUF2794)
MEADYEGVSGAPGLRRWSPDPIIRTGAAPPPRCGEVMSEGEIAEPLRGVGAPGVVPFPATAPKQVSFNRAELRRILDLYGRMVAEGEWRDYAIDFTRDKAVFSVYRRTSEMPLYRIEKDPRLARRQGAYAVIAASGLILKRGHELDRVLRAIDRPLKVVELA